MAARLSRKPRKPTYGKPSVVGQAPQPHMPSRTPKYKGGINPDVYNRPDTNAVIKRKPIPKPPPVAPVEVTAPASTATEPVGAPPVTQQGQQARSDATTTFNDAVNQYRQGLVAQAVSLGAPEVIQALINNPEYAEYVPALQKALQDPMSQWGQFAKQETAGYRDIDQGANADNTFFSGLRMNDRNNFGEEMIGNRRTALGGYNSQASALAAALGEARAAYRRALQEANGIDLDYAKGLEPEATGPDNEPEQSSNPSRPVVVGQTAQKTTGKQVRKKPSVSKKRKRK